jgi:hypothetical protein
MPPPVDKDADHATHYPTEQGERAAAMVLDPNHLCPDSFAITADATRPDAWNQCLRTTRSDSPGFQIVMSMWPSVTSTAEPPVNSAR